jgi:hypothetical protein
MTFSRIKAINEKNCQILKIVIARRARKKILRELDEMGIKESTVFPDLNALCVDICRKWRKGR